MARTFDLPPEEQLEYPNVSYLVRTYFDQDWDTIGANPDIILAAFRDAERPEMVLATIKEICDFILKFGTEDIVLGRAFDAAFEPQIAFYHWHSRDSYDGLMNAV